MAGERENPLLDATGFQWDAGNSQKVAGRHHVEPGECEQAFFQDPFVVSYDGIHSADERRWRALGRTTGGRLLFVVFTMQGALIRVLAARDMNRKERRAYAEIAAGTEKDSDV
jgi:hypothetical protein